jgi:hypothetical protein
LVEDFKLLRKATTILEVYQRQIFEQQLNIKCQENQKKSSQIIERERGLFAHVALWH